VTCRIALHHFPSPRQALHEVARVLKPGGVFGFTDNVTVESESAAAYYNEYERLRDLPHQRVHSLSELHSMFCAAGFEIQATRTLTKAFEFNDWSDRQRVSDSDKHRLRQMMDEIPAELQPLFQPRSADGTLYFNLWEAVIVAHR
jgi:SAM-dependent methyltransferase